MTQTGDPETSRVDSSTAHDQLPTPPPGQILTGKQEHCKTSPSLLPATLLLTTTKKQTSNASCSTVKSAAKSPNSTPPQPYDDSALRSDLNSARLPRSTRNFRFCATFLCTMCAISRFWTRLTRRSFGKINYKWCVFNIGVCGVGGSLWLT